MGGWVGVGLSFLFRCCVERELLALRGGMCGEWVGGEGGGAFGSEGRKYTYVGVHLCAVPGVGCPCFALFFYANGCARLCGAQH